MTKKKCVKGWGCGNACISRTRKCSSNQTDEGKKIVETFEQYIGRLGKKANTGGIDELLQSDKPTGDIVSGMSTADINKMVQQFELAIGAVKEGEGPSLSDFKAPLPEGRFTDFDLRNGELEDTKQRKEKVARLEKEKAEVEADPSTFDANEYESAKEHIDDLEKSIHAAKYGQATRGVRGILQQKYREPFDGDLTAHDKQVAEEADINLDSLKSAVLDFTRGGYTEMRDIEAGRQTTQSKEQREEKIDIINDAIKKLPPYQDAVYRGVKNGFTESKKRFFNSLKELKPGDSFKQASLSSYSGDEKVAKRFGGITSNPNTPDETGIMFRIQPGKNTRGFSVAPLSAFTTEQEIIVGAGDYKVTDVTFDELGYRIIDIEEA